MSRVTTVIGLKRGGTSLVAGIVHRLGIPMGQRFAPPDAWNLDGFYEDLDFGEGVKGLLGGLTLRCGRIEHVTNQAPVDAMTAFISAHNRDYPRWGLKNFCLNYLLAEFVERCRPAQVDVLRVTRDFDSAVDSFAAQNQREKTQNECLEEQAHLLFNTEKSYKNHAGSKLTVAYEDLLREPFRETRRIAAWLEVEWSMEAALMVNPARRHF